MFGRWSLFRLKHAAQQVITVVPSSRQSSTFQGRLPPRILQQLNDIYLMSDKLFSSDGKIPKTAITTLSPIIDSYRNYAKNVGYLEELSVMLSDPDFRELGTDEIQRVKHSLEEMERELIQQLLPEEPESNSLLVELRAATGGEEAMLFTQDMLSFYQRYAAVHGIQHDLIMKEESHQGLREGILELKGHDAFAYFKFESGVHRVQRVPVTDNAGRVHTSTMTVAVMPSPKDSTFRLNDKDLRIDTYRSSGAGGQHVNTTDSAIRITHLPTGITVAIQDERSQHKNKAKALNVLSARVYAHFEEERNREQQAFRQAQIKRGDRSDKIRTYNFPQGRLTDHRIGVTLQNLNDILSTGQGMERIIEALTEHEKSQQMEALDLSHYVDLLKKSLSQ